MKSPRKKKAGKEIYAGSGRVRTRRPALVALATLCALAVLAPAASAKKKKPPTKTVAGEVMDQSDNPIVGASVELTNLRTGKKLASYSEAGGRYSFTGLDPNDDYQVQASFQGNSSEVRKASLFDDRATVVLNLQIPPPPQQ